MSIWTHIRKPLPWYAWLPIVLLAGFLTYKYLYWQPDRDPISLELIRAIDIGDDDKVRSLLDQGANVNAFVQNPFMGDHSTERYVTPLYWAYKMDRQETIRILRAEGAHLTSSKDPKAALIAVKYNDAAELERLINKGVSLKWKDKVGQTLLHYAAFAGNAEVARVLIENGVAKDLRSLYGETPLDIAEKHKHQPIIDLLKGKSKK